MNWELFERTSFKKTKSVFIMLLLIGYPKWSWFSVSSKIIDWANRKYKCQSINGYCWFIDVDPFLIARYECQMLINMSS